MPRGSKRSNILTQNLHSKGAVYFKYAGTFVTTRHESGTVNEKSFCEFLILASLKETLIRD